MLERSFLQLYQELNQDDTPECNRKTNICLDFKLKILLKNRFYRHLQWYLSFKLEDLDRHADCISWSCFPEEYLQDNTIYFNKSQIKKGCYSVL